MWVVNMKRVAIFLVVIFLVSNIFTSSFLAVPLKANPPSNDKIVFDSPVLQTSPDNYDTRCVYYIRSPSIHRGVRFLSGVPLCHDLRDPTNNSLLLVNGAINPFPWPWMGQRPAELVLNKDFTGQPFISLILNTLGRPGKTIKVSVGIDSNDHYDSHVPSTLEHRCNFPEYQTTNDLNSGTMEEEVYEAYGTWESNNLPYKIEKGRVIFEITMTSPNGDTAILYCGFGGKDSWFAFPYMHTDVIPHAKIKLSSEWENRKIMAGDKIVFDASDSFDPNDDFNGNKKIDPTETDRLRYKWDFGDSSISEFEYKNKIVTHKYSSENIPLRSEFKLFKVNLTVTNYKGFKGFDEVWIKIYRGNHSPEIISLKVNNEDLVSGSSKAIKSILDKRIKVYFSANAEDQDGDECIYHWDLDSDGSTYKIEGNKETAASFNYTFSPEEYGVGEHIITLTVSDGTLSANAIASCIIDLQKNINPVPIIRAKREYDSNFYENNITVKLNQLITFLANESFDPDNLPGIDLNNDYLADIPLRYRWNIDSPHGIITSGWAIEPVYGYIYTNPGRYRYIITLDVYDGLNVTTSAPFEVYINVPPAANFFIEPVSYNLIGDLELGRPIMFNGSLSLDPNDDRIVNYTWEICDGDKVIWKFDKIISHTFHNLGLYKVSLTVYDGVFWSEPYEIQFLLQKPQRTIYPRYRIYPLEVFTGEPVYFEVSKTTFSFAGPGFQNKDISFIWCFDDNNSNITKDRITTHVFEKAGVYTVSLTIQYCNELIEASSEIILTIKNRLPKALISQISEQSVGETVILSGADSFDLDGQIVTYIWKFGDGSEPVRTNKSHIGHIWSTSGTYTIELMVEDDLGAIDETQFRLEVLPRVVDQTPKTFNYPLIVFIVIILANLLFVPILIKLLAHTFNQKK